MRARDLPVNTIFMGLFCTLICGAALFLFNVDPMWVVPPLVLVLPIGVLRDRARAARRPSAKSVGAYCLALAVGALPISFSVLIASAGVLVVLALVGGFVASRLSRASGSVVGLGADRVTLRTPSDVLVSFPRRAVSAASGFLLETDTRMSMLGWGKLGPSSVPFRRETTVEFSPLLVRASDQELTIALRRHVGAAVLGIVALTLVSFAGNIMRSVYFPTCAINEVVGCSPPVDAVPIEAARVDATNGEPAARRCAIAMRNGRPVSFPIR